MNIRDLLVIGSAAIDVLTPIERVRVLNVLTDHPPDQALVAWALGTDLRASELTGAKVGDLISDDDGAEWLRVVQGKGRKDRMISLSSHVAQVLCEHITQRKAKCNDYLFALRLGEFRPG